MVVVATVLGHCQEPICAYLTPGKQYRVVIVGDRAEPSARALAHYLWPPQWFGEPPTQAGQVGDLIVATELPNGIRSRVFRDGMIAFSLGPNQPSYEDNFIIWLQTGVRIMNAHLACLNAALAWPPVFRSAVVTPWTTMQVEFDSGRFSAMTDVSSGGTVLALYGARKASYAGEWDWRFQRGGSLIAVGVDRVERSMVVLGELLDRPSSEGVLLRAEMLLRARVALMDGDSSGALTNAWTAMEGLLGDLLTRYLDNNQGRDVVDHSGAPARFINSRRRKFFEGSEMTIRHVAELLSLLDVLPFHLYRATIKCGRARNDWLHTEKPPPPEIASLAIRTCGELFELIEEVPLQLLPTSDGD